METHDLYARIPEVLFQALKALAEKHKRSVTGEAEWALQQYVEANGEKLPELPPRPKQGRPQPKGEAPPKRPRGRPRKGA